MVAVGRHDGLNVCQLCARGPQSQVGSEPAVRIAADDLVPTEANLLPKYSSSQPKGGGHTENSTCSQIHVQPFFVGNSRRYFGAGPRLAQRPRPVGGLFSALQQRAAEFSHVSS
jgi:hypothetical protein